MISSRLPNTCVGVVLRARVELDQRAVDPQPQLIVEIGECHAVLAGLLIDVSAAGAKSASAVDRPARPGRSPDRSSPVKCLPASTRSTISSPLRLFDFDVGLDHQIADPVQTELDSSVDALDRRLRRDRGISGTRRVVGVEIGDQLRPSSARPASGLSGGPFCAAIVKSSTCLPIVVARHEVAIAQPGRFVAGRVDRVPLVDRQSRRRRPPLRLSTRCPRSCGCHRSGHPALNSSTGS